MKRETINGLPLWQFNSLSRQDRIKHFVSGRYTNDSERVFTLSLSSSADKDFIHQNRALLAHSLGIAPSSLFFPSQIHETRIVRVARGTRKEELQNTDALITNESGICICVMSADCVPILLYDKKNHAVGAVHSGWRGTVAKILEKTLHEMNKEFGTRGEDILAGIGPSASQDSYEVGEEVIREVNQAFGSQNDLMLTQPANKAKLDLWRANELQLLKFGVNEASIEISDLCTIKNNDHFFSARQGDSGRFAAGILLAD